MAVLAVITARGGSLTLPRKNVLPFAGKPLIAHSIEAALSARERGAPILDVVVSTDDEEIVQVSRRYGAKAPFLRPAELATSEAASLPVVQHAVDFMEEAAGSHFDWILLLQPTSPLRTAADVVEALSLGEEKEATAVISVTDANSAHPAKLKLVEDGMLRPYLGTSFTPVRRQDFGFDVYRTNGAIYLTRRDVLMDEHSFYGKRPCAYVMPSERSIDIDTRLDFEIAEFLFQRERAGRAEALA